MGAWSHEAQYQQNQRVNGGWQQFKCECYYKVAPNSETWMPHIDI